MKTLHQQAIEKITWIKNQLASSKRISNISDIQESHSSVFVTYEFEGHEFSVDFDFENNNFAAYYTNGDFEMAPDQDYIFARTSKAIVRKIKSFNHNF